MNRLAVVLIGAACAMSLSPASPARAAAPAKYFSTCKVLNATYKQGVGLPGAKDKTKRATSRKVTNFTRNATVYKQNKSHDTDHNGIACER